VRRVIESTGDKPQCVGHDDTNSTSEKPSFFSCTSNARLIAFFALFMFAGEFNATRST
jgi:hypothetical protein